MNDGGEEAGRAAAHASVHLFLPTNYTRASLQSFEICVSAPKKVTI